MAPPGGYPAVNVTKNLPKGGASSITMALGGTFIFCYGTYKIIQANHLRRCVPPALPPLGPECARSPPPPVPAVRALCCCREWRREEMDIRLATLPFLMVENDVRGEYLKNKVTEHEAELMKDVPGWEAGASVYKTRFMTPMPLKALPTSTGRLGW